MTIKKYVAREKLTYKLPDFLEIWKFVGDKWGGQINEEQYAF